MTPVNRYRNPLAMDRRVFDKEGFLHVDKANISKANVCPYLGKEIPDFQRLGLDPERTYLLWRHPAELTKAANSFNGKPILCDHTPVSAASIDPEMIVGTTGRDAQFDGEYLTNSLDFWPKSAIDGIESAAKKELSCGYAYTCDMTPGVTPSGDHYDGIMRDIIGNHVALVKEGRAGPDVMVADSKPNLRSIIKMATDYKARRRAADEAEQETGEWISQLSDEDFERLAGLVDGEDQRRGLDARRKARDTRRARDMDPDDWSSDYRARRRKVSDSEENPNILRSEEPKEPQQPDEGEDRAYDGRYSSDARANMRAHRAVDSMKADAAIRQHAPGIATDAVGGLIQRIPSAARIFGKRKPRDLWEVKQPDGAA